MTARGSRCDVTTVSLYSDVAQTWVLLAYRLPREPSTPRIALWRHLRRLGALQLLDGLVALPLGPETREQLEWLADEVVEAGGEATVWIAEPGQRAQEARALEERLQASVADCVRGRAARRRSARAIAARLRGCAASCARSAPGTTSRRPSARTRSGRSNRSPSGHRLPHEVGDAGAAATSTAPPAPG